MVIFGNIWWHFTIFRDKTMSFIMICHDISRIVMTCRQLIQRGYKYKDVIVETQLHSSSNVSQLFENILFQSPWVRVTQVDQKSFSTLIMTRGHWPWPMGYRNGWSRKVAFLLRKSVHSCVRSTCIYVCIDRTSAASVTQTDWDSWTLRMEITVKMKLQSEYSSCWTLFTMNGNQPALFLLSGLKGSESCMRTTWSHHYSLVMIPSTAEQARCQCRDQWN